jgi:RsiW-degrading membrane proteinase PrsW (M82 family)
MYLVAMKLLAASGNPNLLPTVILLGAFLVPVTYVVFLHENETFTRISPSVIALAFFFGGVLGTFGAQLLEEQLVTGRGLLAMLAVGFSEEVAKLVAISWLLWKKEYRSEMHGIIFGAAAGMGFAAFENMGYGFTFLLQSRGDLNVLGEVLASRGVLAPLGHGTWAAIVAGVLWRERRDGRPRINGAILKTFIGVVALHGLWDWTTVAIPIGLELPGLMLQWRPLDFMIPDIWLPIPGLIIGAVGLRILSGLLREANRSQEATHARIR